MTEIRTDSENTHEMILRIIQKSVDFIYIDFKYCLFFNQPIQSLLN